MDQQEYFSLPYSRHHALLFPGYLQIFEDVSAKIYIRLNTSGVRHALLSDCRQCSPNKILQNL